MNKKLIHILLVEDSLTDADILVRLFKRTTQQEWQVKHVESLSDAIATCSLS
jgi:hypothetical protein